MFNMRRFIRYVFPAFLILMGMMAPLIGCGQKEPERKEKTASVEERKASDKEKEEFDIVAILPGTQKTSGIEVQKIALEYVSAPLSATAVIEINLDRSAKINSRVTGKVVKFIAAQGAKVKAGQPLAYLDSVEIDQLWADYLKAQGRFELACKNLQREEVLYEKKISPEKDVIKAKQGLGEAQADLNLTRGKLRLVGIDITQSDQAMSNRNHELTSVTSPISGLVVERMVSEGEVVGPEKTLFFVADLSSLWISIDVYEKDISQLTLGANSRISVAAFPGKIFKGRISNIGDVIDEKTRTVKARVTIANSNGLLKPGMFASVSIANPKGRQERCLVIPERSILSEGNSRYVFVQKDEGSFIKRAVTVGRIFGSKVEISGGLKEGDSIVTSGAFILKSELKKKELGAD